MPQITIVGRKYHLAFRIIVRCQLREQSREHKLIASADAICLSTDVFDEKEGKRKAFAAMMRGIQRESSFPYSAGDGLRHGLTERRQTWSQFLFWLNGGRKSVMKMGKRKPDKAAVEAK